MLTFLALFVLVPGDVNSNGGERGLRGDGAGGPVEQDTQQSLTVAVLSFELAEEREQALQLTKDFLDYILAHNYCLLDPDLGMPTVWGRWDPDTVNNQQYYSDGRGMNSQQIISWLRSGEYMTGNTTYGEVADSLKADHGYGINAVNAEITVPGGINWSDDELAWFPLYGHLVLTPGAPAKDLELVCSLARYWEQGSAAERASVLAAMHRAAEEAILPVPSAARAWRSCGGVTAAGLGGGSGALVDINHGTPRGGAGRLADDGATAAWSLRTWPLDPVEWGARNSHRADVVLDPRGDTRFGDDGAPGVGRVLPAHERSLFRWNGSPKTLDQSGWPGAISSIDPSPYLLGYWLSRYHSLVAGTP